MQSDRDILKQEKNNFIFYGLKKEDRIDCWREASHLSVLHKYLLGTSITYLDSYILHMFTYLSQEWIRFYIHGEISVSITITNVWL